MYQGQSYTLAEFVAKFLEESDWDRKRLTEYWKNNMVEDIRELICFNYSCTVWKLSN